MIKIATTQYDEYIAKLVERRQQGANLPSLCKICWCYLTWAQMGSHIHTDKKDIATPAKYMSGETFKQLATDQGHISLDKSEIKKILVTPPAGTQKEKERKNSRISVLNPDQSQTNSIDDQTTLKKVKKNTESLILQPKVKVELRGSPTKTKFSSVKQFLARNKDNTYSQKHEEATRPILESLQEEEKTSEKELNEEFENVDEEVHYHSIYYLFRQRT